MEATYKRAAELARELVTLSIDSARTFDDPDPKPEAEAALNEVMEEIPDYLAGLVLLNLADLVAYAIWEAIRGPGIEWHQIDSRAVRSVWKRVAERMAANESEAS